jgi:hypothetical protein
VVANLIQAAAAARNKAYRHHGAYIQWLMPDLLPDKIERQMAVIRRKARRRFFFGLGPVRVSSSPHQICGDTIGMTSRLSSAAVQDGRNRRCRRPPGSPAGACLTPLGLGMNG